jgi:hypothetical protein
VFLDRPWRGPLITQRIDGDAISVLHTVVCEWKH